MTEEEIAKVYRALSVPCRLKIVRAISRRPLCVNALTTRLGISQPAVSQHLNVLKDAGLVLGERRGYFTHYSINWKRVEEFNRAVAEIMGREFVGAGIE
ncbi:MAG: ArsR/SmtB family transcription factor [bacterium]